MMLTKGFGGFSHFIRSPVSPGVSCHMTISIRVLKSVLLALILASLNGCKTDFDTFDKIVLKGIESSEIERALQKHQISYRYLSCLELKEELSSLKQGCTEVESNGVYIGWVNNGAYMLGMGSADVYFEVEIGKNNKVIEVYTNEIHTFL